MKKLLLLLIIPLLNFSQSPYQKKIDVIDLINIQNIKTPCDCVDNKIIVLDQFLTLWQDSLQVYGDWPEEGYLGEYIEVLQKKMIDIDYRCTREWRPSEKNDMSLRIDEEHQCAHFSAFENKTRFYGATYFFEDISRKYGNSIYPFRIKKYYIFECERCGGIITELGRIPNSLEIHDNETCLCHQLE